MSGYKLWHLTAYPSAIFLIGFIPVRIFGKDWDTFCLLLFSFFIGNCVAVYILIDSAVEMFRAQGYEAIVNPQRQPVTVNVPDLNPKYGLTLRPVQIDTTRLFARALLEFPDNLTETYWLKGHPSKWHTMHGVGRADFVECKKHLTRLGALELVNPNATNSPHKVASRRILAQIAGGRSPVTHSPIGQKR